MATYSKEKHILVTNYDTSVIQPIAKQLQIMILQMIFCAHVSVLLLFWKILNEQKIL